MEDGIQHAVGIRKARTIVLNQVDTMQESGSLGDIYARKESKFGVVNPLQWSGQKKNLRTGPSGAKDDEISL